MKRIRRPFTLLELMIALVLVVGLMTTLFGYYRYLAYQGTQLAERRAETFQQRLAQFRLTMTVMKAANDAKKTTFYTSDDENDFLTAGSLVFVYDRGPDLVPELSYRLLCRLYLDREARLCLASWPEPGRSTLIPQPFRHEVLLDHVDALSFRFFSPPIEGELVVQPDRIDQGAEESTPPIDTWLENWDRSYHQLPALTQVIVTRNGEDLVFAMPLVFCPQTIIYRE